MAKRCGGCEEPIEADESTVEHKRRTWHEACFEVSGGPTYCCGMMYENGEAVCRSCGEPL